MFVYFHMLVFAFDIYKFKYYTYELFYFFLYLFLHISITNAKKIVRNFFFSTNILNYI
jgi:hypothetical protein